MFSNGGHRLYNLRTPRVLKSTVNQPPSKILYDILVQYNGN